MASLLQQVGQSASCHVSWLKAFAESMAVASDPFPTLLSPKPAAAVAPALLSPSLPDQPHQMSKLLLVWWVMSNWTLDNAMACDLRKGCMRAGAALPGGRSSQQAAEESLAGLFQRRTQAASQNNAPVWLPALLLTPSQMTWRQFCVCHLVRKNRDGADVCKEEMAIVVTWP